MRRIFTVIIIIIFITLSCKKKEQTDKKIKPQHLISEPLDSIKKLEPVFLSFYPEMSYGEFLDQVYIEKKNENLFIQEKSDSFKYIFVIDTIKTIPRLKNRLGSFDNDKVLMHISQGDKSIDLISSNPINNEKFIMVKKLYTEKYGKMKDTILPFIKGNYFKSDNKVIFLNLCDNSFLQIQYFSKKSFQSKTDNYYDGIRIRNDSIRLKRLREEKSEKNKKLKKDMIELL